MTDSTFKELPISYFTKRRIFRFLGIVLGILGMSFLFSMLVIYAIKQRSDLLIYSHIEYFYLLLTALLWLVIAFGVGLYISGIFIEQYSMRNLKDNPEYSRLKVVTKLLHGRVSHVFMYSGGMAVLLVISLFEITNPAVQVDAVSILTYAIIGIILGFIYYKAQIQNLTWKYQFPFFTYIFSQGLVIYTFLGELDMYPFFTFFIFFSGIAFLGLLIKYYSKI